MEFSRSSAGRRRLQALSCLLVASGLAGACRDKPPVSADVVARFAQQEVVYSEFETSLRKTVDTPDASLASDVLSRLFDQYLDERLLFALASEKGYESTGGNSLELLETLLTSEIQPVNDADASAYFEAHRSEFERSEEVRLRQILVQERAVAEKALEALRGGEDFAAVARRLSQGPNARKGGDQGRLAEGDLPPHFAEVIAPLGAGEISPIISADYGLLIFQVVERLPAESLPFERVIDQIRESLHRQRANARLQSLIAEARESYDVRIYETNLPFDYRGFYASQESD